MTPDQNLPDDDWDEGQFTPLFRSANREMPPPDRQFLEQLRVRSVRAFEEAAQAQRAAPRSQPASAGPRPARSRRPTLAAACALALLASAAILWLRDPPAAPATTIDLATVLDRTAAAESVHLRFERDARQRTEAWLARPGHVRVDYEDGTYEIAREDTAWRVDERDNRATPEPSPYVHAAGEPARGVLLDLFELSGAEARASLLDDSRTEKTEFVQNGRSLVRFRGPVPAAEGELAFEAVADAQSLLLQSLHVQVLRGEALVPLVELNVVAVNEPVEKEKFAISDTLTDDGRIGRTTDHQGLVAIRPPTHERWTPVCEATPIKMGDWLRTDVRGANAVTVRLVRQATLTFGPGTLAELSSPTRVRVHRGELAVQTTEQEPLELLGPDGKVVQVSGRKVFRATADALSLLEQDPQWLAYFQGVSTSESLGSLIASVDGRNVPLTVGFHRVSVDVRDQIARTVIEESFVNRTDLDLEGVFYFPLPQDASISGFGMWIGDELVEADIVEKQRAREIYEEILREKRDPGLLEWTGGNIFKARVFPIPRHAEKRVRISYTQVLPARGSAYRYSYALQSDLLRLHPLRELSLDVRVHSQRPLRNVHCPTHTVRTSRTTHSAQVEFSSQEYVPTRDFEVVIETEGSGGDVVLIPHQRGEDGYFMLQFSPPAAGTWQRDVVPDGQPIEMLVLADTSLSMDAAQRRAQADVVAALLQSLAPDDRVNLAVCDVECDWAFEQSRPADEQSLAAAREFLARRRSLGWTDLDRAFASAFPRCGPRTHVVYIGDGVVTTGEGLPSEFVRRLRRLHEGVPGTCHAIAPGNSFESMVLDGIAALGGGSVRRVTGEQGPAAIARDLLREIARPELRDLRVEFRGIRTARVYPERLPNLPAGAQQIVLGRYLPPAAELGQVGAEHSGEVVVTGMQNGQPVTFRTPISLASDEEGNSFIPRLWARLHLDSLLAQGSSPAIRDEIIALSEEFQIMTPYTSFLVLETDADRERFKVQRRFRLRDGERFFQEGRDDATYELVQQQMRRAGNWRLGLRQNVLRELAGLGRTPEQLQGVSRLGQRAKLRSLDSLPMSVNGPLGVPAGFGGYGNGFPDDSLMFFGRPTNRAMDKEELGALGDVNPYWAFALDAGAEPALAGKPGSGFEHDALGRKQFYENAWFDDSPSMPRGGNVVSSDLLALAAEPAFANGALRGLASASGGDLSLWDQEWGLDKSRLPGLLPPGGGGGMGFGRGGELLGVRFRRDSRWAPQPDSIGWMQTLFPTLPAPALAPPVRRVQSVWPDEALELSRSLLRTEALSRMSGGVEIGRVVESFDPRWNELAHRQRRIELYSPDKWLTRDEGDWSQTLVHWCSAQERGVLGLAFLLGRARAAVPADRTPAVLSLYDYSLTPLYEAFFGHVPAVAPQGEERVQLTLTVKDSPRHETRMLIDTRRHVLLSSENRDRGRTTSRTTFSEFLEAAGQWWPGRIETADDQGRLTSVITQMVAPLDPERFAARFQEELSPRDRVQLIPQPLPTLAAAKAAQAALGRLTYEMELVPLLFAAQSQQWARAFEHLERSERLAAGKPGVRWVRDALWQAARRHQELKTRLEAEAGGELPPGGDGRFLSEHLVSQAASILEANEMLAFLERLRPAYERQPPHTGAALRFGQRRITYLMQTGQIELAVRERRQLALDNPHDADEQREYAQMLFNHGDYDAAYAWLEQALAGDPPWRGDEDERLRSTATMFFQQEGRSADLVTYLRRWTARNPDSTTPYQQLLSALYQDDRIAEGDALIAQWLRDAQVAGDVPPAAGARLTAAIQMALGQGHGIHLDHVDEKWHAPLADTALFFARRDDDLHPADLVMGHWRFTLTGECLRVRQTVGRWLAAEVGTLPIDRLTRYVDWALGDSRSLAVDEWKGIVARLLERWAGETDPEARRRLSRPLTQILSQQIGTTEHLDFLRRQLRESPPEHRQEAAGALWDALLAQPWAAEIETELLGLLQQFSDAEDPAERTLAQIPALQRLVDVGVAARYAAGLKTIDKLETLPRPERAQRQAQQQRLAREGMSRWLREAQERVEGLLVPWLDIERLTLDVQAGSDAARAFEDAWERLATASPPVERISAATELVEALRHRVLTLLAHLATRPDADPAWAERTLRYIDERLAEHPDEERWRVWKWKLLVALDRPEALRESLAAWGAGSDPLQHWRLALGYLLAEQGGVPQAIGLFEGVEAANGLGPDAYRALAGWYLAADRRADYERAQRRVYQTLDEWRLSQWIAGALQPWQRTDQPLPPTLDEQVLLMFGALFEKSGTPESYLWQLQQFYQATHDFRLLAVVADSVLGRTPQQVYPFLTGLRSLLTEVRDEATADELTAHITRLRERTSDEDERSAPQAAQRRIDRRALDLLESLVERRAAEVQNQPGPHMAKSLAALTRAFERDWGPGEERLMADLLAGLGAISQVPLAEEQQRQMRVLHERQAAGSIDRLHVARRRAELLTSYGRPDDGIDLLEAGLAEFRQARGGDLPSVANEHFAVYVSLLNSQRRYARAEQVVQAELARPLLGQQKLWLTQRLYEVYHEALRNEGTVSLGSGRELFREFERVLFAGLDTGDQNHRYQLVGTLCGVYHTARQKQFTGFAEALRQFAARVVPAVLERQTNFYTSIVSQVASTLHDILGPRDALAFLIERIELEPARLRYFNQAGWQQHAYTLAAWRHETKDLGDLAPRLLAIVVAELRRDLVTQQSRTRTMYHSSHSYFWTEQADAFQKVADEVLAERGLSNSVAQYIADYLFHGLQRQGRAIEILFLAHGRGVLDESGRARLVDYLHQARRWGESIALLEPLVAEHPERMQYRTWLMQALFHSQRPEELRALVARTDAFFHEQDRWTEGALAELAAACLRAELFEQSTAYYDELVRKYQQARPGRGAGDETLSGHFTNLALAWAGLGRTAEAVDAAASAIVIWGPAHRQRGEALSVLRQVLERSPDLAAYAAALDAETARSGQDRPIIRKALGQALLAKGQAEAAKGQLLRAIEFQPHDVESHQALIACFDRLEDRSGAIAQLHASLELSRRELTLYQDLCRRYSALEQPREAERALTSVLDALPSEAETHALLAEARQEQGRWEEAIVQWEQVARLRAREPTGLLKLAAAQLHEQRWSAASATLDTLERTGWPPRFGDVPHQARELRRKLDARER